MYVSQSMLPVDLGSSKPNGASIKIEQRRCAVCKDIASGYHYGVWSCEGCKAFFKRSIQGPCDYICPATNSCTIDKHRRKSCQACRLRTCYEVGMSKGGTRRERRPYRRKSSNVTSGGEMQAQNIGTYPMYKINTSASSEQMIKLDRSDIGIASLPGNGMVNPDVIGKHDGDSSGGSITPMAKAEQIRAADYMQILVNLEYSPTAVGITCGNTGGAELDSLEGVMRTLSILFDKELVFLINWAKCIPNYTSLLIEDQIRLIESGWLEVLVLNCIRHSIPLKGAKIFFAQDLILDRELLRCISLVDLADGFLSLIHEFYVLDISVAQFSALKAVCFLNSTNRTFDSGPVLQQLRAAAIKCLRFVCGTSNSPGTAERCAPSKEEQLLLLLPHVKALSNKLMVYLVRMKEMQVITAGDLLHEMLDAQDGLLPESMRQTATESMATDKKADEEIVEDYFEKTEQSLIAVPPDEERQKPADLPSTAPANLLSDVLKQTGEAATTKDGQSSLGEVVVTDNEYVSSFANISPPQ